MRCFSLTLTCACHLSDWTDAILFQTIYYFGAKKRGNNQVVETLQKRFLDRKSTLLTRWHCTANAYARSLHNYNSFKKIYKFAFEFGFLQSPPQHCGLRTGTIQLLSDIWREKPFTGKSPDNLHHGRIIELVPSKVFYVCSQVPSNYYPIFQEGNPSPANLRTIHIVEELSNWRHLNIFYVCSQVS